MAFRGKHRKTHRARTMIVAGAATALAGGIVAPAAHAWDTDPHVNLAGGGGCRQLLYQAVAVSFHLDNGESAVSVFTNGSYNVNFYNIPATPVGVGGNATVVCSNVITNASYVWSRPVSVQRPRVGVRQTLNLGGG